MAEKGRKVEELKQANTNTTPSSMEPVKGLDSVRKQPGQVGLWAPQSMDAIRKAPRDSRVDKGDRVFGGVTAPKVSDQTYDCYNTPRGKVNPPTKKKEE